MPPTSLMSTMITPRPLPVNSTITISTDTTPTPTTPSPIPFLPSQILLRIADALLQPALQPNLRTNKQRAAAKSDLFSWCLVSRRVWQVSSYAVLKRRLLTSCLSAPLKQPPLVFYVVMEPYLDLSWPNIQMRSNWEFDRRRFNRQ